MRRHLFIIGGLVVVTLAIYAQVLGHQFINLDDHFWSGGSGFSAHSCR